MRPILERVREAVVHLEGEDAAIRALRKEQNWEQEEDKLQEKKHNWNGNVRRNNMISIEQRNSH